MINAKKAQIMLSDVLLFLGLALVILSLEGKMVERYVFDVQEINQITKLLEQEMFIENIILSCEQGLSIRDDFTKVCYKNKIKNKNINFLKDKVCEIKVDDEVFFKNLKTIKTTHTRGVVYEAEFRVLEVSFCD